MAPARLRQMAMPRRSERAWVATARLWRKAKSGQRVTTMAEVEGGAEAKGTGPATAVWGGAKSCEGLSNDAKAGEDACGLRKKWLREQDCADAREGWGLSGVALRKRRPPPKCFGGQWRHDRGQGGRLSARVVGGS